MMSYFDDDNHQMHAVMIGMGAGVISGMRGGQSMMGAPFDMQTAAMVGAATMAYMMTFGHNLPSF